MPSLLEKAQAELIRQRDGLPASAGRYDAPSPSASAYNVFGPQYASVLARPEKSASLNTLNRLSLMLESGNEAQRYERALTAAQENALAGIDRQGFYDNQKTIIENEPEGLIGMRINSKFDDGRYGIINDPVMQAVSNDLYINKQDSEATKTYADAVGTVAEKTGVLPTPEYIGDIFTPVTSNTRTEVDPIDSQRYGFSAGNIIEDDQNRIDEQNAISNRITAEAARTRALNNDSDEPKVTLNINSRGEVMSRSIQGSPNAVDSFGADDVSGNNNPLPAPLVQGQQHGFIVERQNDGTYKMTDPATGNFGVYDPEGIFIGKPPSGGAKGASGRRQNAPAKPVSGEVFEKHLLSITGGGTITNRERTAADRARLRRQGYKPAENSYHNVERGGRGRDIVVPASFPRGAKGEAILKKEFARRGVNIVEVIDEGDHFHIAWGP